MSQVQRHEIPILTTFDAPPGYVIERIVGPCWGITVRSRSIVGTTCAGCQTVFGGEITMFTELAMSTRNEAMNRLEVTARQMGANCILGMRFDSSELMQNTNEIVAYGTAAVIRQVQRRGVSRLPPALARRVDRLARRAHAFHRFAHHPLCGRYAAEVIRIGRRTRICLGCSLTALGAVAGVALGLLRPAAPAAGLLAAGIVLVAAVPLVVRSSTPARASGARSNARARKLLTRLLPAAVAGFADRPGARRALARARRRRGAGRGRGGLGGPALPPARPGPLGVPGLPGRPARLALPGARAHRPAGAGPLPAGGALDRRRRAGPGPGARARGPARHFASSSSLACCAACLAPGANAPFMRKLSVLFTSSVETFEPGTR